ncbi:TPA: NUDIX hydrolase [Candidatus Latescibacteria bacterium]|nr:NUDIX hydrolase [Gemmatimonadota bacterium]HAA73741.1 NUDIX hydrolase [Candidatus Latescibacterota bacterium]|tara:strand:- start:238 stop:690 length:453 start_codon:yes stop_codon:yes gene_type:complete
MSRITRDFTATTFVVQEGRTLLLRHKKLGAWFPPGGHIDKDELPDDAARREVLEESGLQVELMTHRSTLGSVGVISQPECILLEDIHDDHQHIDLIYFARVIGGALEVSEREADDYRWCSHEELESDDIHEDIRRLGQQAIEKVGASESA